MRKSHSQLVIQRRQNWSVATEHNTVFNGNFLTLNDKLYSKGYLCLKSIDSTQAGFDWQRMTVNYDDTKDSVVNVYAFASDKPLVDGVENFDSQLSKLSGEAEIRKTLKKLYKMVSSGKDFYLNLKGRFLWVAFEIIAGDSCTEIKQLRFHMTGDHMIDYLPAIYRQGGDFVKRYLSVFDSIVTDLERDIEHITSRLDYCKSSDEDLMRLASIVGIEDFVDIKSLRSYISTALDDFDGMYTIQGVKRYVKRLVGNEPIIIEYDDIDPYSRDCPDSKTYFDLYGDVPYKFFVLLDNDVFISREQADNFIKKMEEFTPLGKQCEVVILYHQLQLNSHCYLGINSYISGFEEALVGANSTLSSNTVVAE